MSEEASILKIPAVTIRDAHERPEGVEKGVFALSIGGDNLDTLVKLSVDHHDHSRRHIAYPEEHNSLIVVKLILGYLSKIKFDIWKTFTH